MSDTKTPQIGGEDTQDPVLGYCLVDANMLIEGNRLVWARLDTGCAVNSTYANANPSNVSVLGVCNEHVDNTTGNGFNNSGLAGGATVRYNQGTFLLNGDGTIVAGSLLAPVFLASDVQTSNSGLVTVSLTPIAANLARPFVGHVTPIPVPATTIPYAGKIPVRIGRAAGPGPVPGVLQQDYTIDPTAAYTGAFNVAPGFLHKINPSGATFAYAFPPITVDMNGLKVGIVNVSTGSTATVAVPSGSNNIGNSAGTSTGATAAGPTGGNTKVYVADFSVAAWLTGV